MVSAFHTVPSTTVPLICVPRIDRYTTISLNTLVSCALFGKRQRGGVRSRAITYKRVGGVAVDRDRDDKDCRPQGPGQKPVERGPDGVQAGTVENPNEPTIRKRRQLRCVYWYPRVLRSCTTTVSPLVFSRG